MAVVITQRSLSCGTDMSKYERRGGLGRNTLEIDAVPGGDGRGKDARLGAKLGVGVVPDS
jgi:hypothetical protein